MDEKLWEKELWTQNEVAGYFRVVPATIKNWREQGLIGYCQPPGSRRVLYYRDEIRRFRDQNTNNAKGGQTAPKAQPVKGKPVVSAKPEKVWRI